ncbi:uncharacterized protein [Hemitrygon akajei]|uniref:uncharacterized protein n=1 Tax=Hemitrygon akajei TaxID=2704970 RepID=UPI003BF9C6AE
MHYPRKDSWNNGNVTTTYQEGDTHQLICDALDIEWKYHTPWHPQSSGRVERMNSTLKAQLTKLMLETKLPWTKCLPIALLRIHTAPRKDIGVSPYEMLFGLPYWNKIEGYPTLQGGDLFVKNNLLALSRSFAELRKKGLLAQTPPLDFALHQIVPGDWVLVRTWKPEKLQPQWEGPFQVLLTTEAAVRTKEKGWTHASRVKGPVKPESRTEWTCVPGEEPLVCDSRTVGAWDLQIGDRLGVSALCNLQGDFGRQRMSAGTLWRESCELMLDSISSIKAATVHRLKQ